MKTSVVLSRMAAAVALVSTACLGACTTPTIEELPEPHATVSAVMADVETVAKTYFD